MDVLGFDRCESFFYGGVELNSLDVLFMSKNNEREIMPPQGVPGNAPVVPPSMTPADAYLPRHLKGHPKDYFSYSALFLPIAAADTTSFNIAIQADSSFMIQYITRVVNDVANLVFFDQAPLLMLITDTGAGRVLMDTQVQIENLAGTAQRPFIPPFPKFVQASATLSVQLQNLDPANAFNVRITFHGFKVF